MPREILHALTTQLKDWDIRGAAVKVLCKQSSLPNEILNAITALLKYNSSPIQSAAIKVLGSQPILPEKYLNDIAAQLDNDTFWIAELAEEPLRKRKDFYPTLLKGPYAPSLYKVLLWRSFREELSWCVDNDGNSFFNMPGDGGRLVIGEQYDVKAIIEKIRPANYPVQ